jgi:ornithine cyclodeaminase
MDNASQPIIEGAMVMTYQILTDEDVLNTLTMKDIVGKIEIAMREMAGGSLVAPPRFRVDAEKGALVFTAGAATQHEKVIGFRVYDTFPHKAGEWEQLVVVFDSDNGTLKGVVIGQAVGRLRTGAIGGVAINMMARQDAKVVGVIGAGVHARTQLEGAAAVRNLEHVFVYSRTSENREGYAAEMSQKLGVEVVAVDSAEKAVREADIVLCATKSPTPVIEVGWLKAGTHINTVGPKYLDAHEMDLAVADRSQVIVTDSMGQVEDYGNFFLENTPHLVRMVELDDVVAGREKGRTSAEDITLFCSVGLAGTEVVVANEVLKRAATKLNQ